MSNYASLKLILDERVEAARERIIYCVTAHMDAQGMMPCGRESAERTVAMAHIDGGWALFDDCADRLNIHYLDGLGLCLTAKLHTRAVGVMGAGEGRMLRYYTDGHIMDTYITSPQAFGRTSKYKGCKGHAILWRGMLCEGGTIKELSAAFQKGQREQAEGFAEIRRLLSLGETAGYGFASMEDSGLQGVITMYFCAANHVRQRWFDRFLKPNQTKKAVASSIFRYPRCKQWR